MFEYMERTKIIEKPKAVPEKTAVAGQYSKDSPPPKARYIMHLSPKHRLNVVMSCEEHVFKRFARFFIHPKNLTYALVKVSELVPGEKTMVPGGTVVMRAK